MTLNCYEFPDTVDAHTRYMNGARQTKGECLQGHDTCWGCSVCEYGWPKCDQFHVLEAQTTISNIEVTKAKNLLKKFGGQAWACHIHFKSGHSDTQQIQV